MTGEEISVEAFESISFITNITYQTKFKTPIWTQNWSSLRKFSFRYDCDTADSDVFF